MKEFYFVRHGQTDANLKGIMCGGMWDLELNSTGLEQAERAANLLKAKVQDINSIFVSPMKRAQQTAGFFAKNFALPMTRIEELREWKIGSWEKVSFESIKEQFLGTGEPPGDGESRHAFQTRVKTGFEKCLVETAPFLMVSHGGVGLALQKILGTDVSRIENCVLHRVYQTTGATWKVETL